MEIHFTWSLRLERKPQVEPIEAVPEGATRPATGSHHSVGFNPNPDARERGRRGRPRRVL